MAGTPRPSAGLTNPNQMRCGSSTSRARVRVPFFVLLLAPPCAPIAPAVPGFRGAPYYNCRSYRARRDQGWGLHVPINPMARAHRHTGLGFTGYILVLTNRPSTPPTTPPTPTAAWSTARFPEQYIVVVEGGAAVVWKGRALRGVVPVDSRTDLWRLLAHASMTVDLGPGASSPGSASSRCVSARRLRVPANTVGAVHARAGGGLTYVDVSDLLVGVERLLRESERVPFSRDGTRYADSAYGDRVTFVAGVAGALRRVRS